MHIHFAGNRNQMCDVPQSEKGQHMNHGLKDQQTQNKGSSGAGEHQIRTLSSTGGRSASDETNLLDSNVKMPPRITMLDGDGAVEGSNSQSNKEYVASSENRGSIKSSTSPTSSSLQAQQVE